MVDSEEVQKLAAALTVKVELAAQANADAAERIRLLLSPETVHLLEFHRAPRCLDQVLLDSPKLQECNHHVDGRELRDARVLKSRVKVFAPRELYAAVLAALQQEEYSNLKACHVVVADRYLDTVLGLVRGLRGKDNVHEKSKDRREVTLEVAEGSQYAVLGEAVVKRTFVHIPIKCSLASTIASRPATF